MNRKNSGFVLLLVTVVGFAVIFFNPPRINVDLNLLILALVVVPSLILTWSGMSRLNLPKSK